MFEILKRQLNVHRSYFLEASAGTGKTFSIVHVVIRLLIESLPQQEPLGMEQILIVTFTRMATRELKSRLRKGLNETFCLLKLALQDLESASNQSPDYLLKIIEQGEFAIRSALRYIDNALVLFDRAQVFTIHGFCYRMLVEYAFEANRGIQFSKRGRENVIPYEAVKNAIKDFFRTELAPSEYSTIQLQIVMNQFRNDFESLLQFLSHQILKGEKIEAYPSFQTSWQEFCDAMHLLKKKWGMQQQLLFEDFCSLAPQYKKTCTKAGEIHEFLKEEMRLLAHLFEQPTWSQEDFNQLLSDRYTWDAISLLVESNLKAKKKGATCSSLHYPGIFESIQTVLFPLIQTARNSHYILARLICDTQRHIQKVFLEEEILAPDDILTTMHRCLHQYPCFVDSVRTRYQVAIVDEFQDTDLIQWDIFQILFLQNGVKNQWLYLVGDPKQSIYAFRRVDIYTYLEALSLIGHDKRETLDANYRSHAGLIEALNTLFCEKNAPGLIALPRFSRSLPYLPMLVPPSANTAPFGYDQKGYIHCFMASAQAGRSKNWPSAELEEELLIPWIAHEMQKIVQATGIQWKDCAVLVQDRYQGARVQTYLRSCGIQALTRRSSNLVDSPLFSALQHSLMAMVTPNNTNTLKWMLGGILIGWDHHQMRLWSEQKTGQEVIWNRLHSLRQVLLKEGIACWSHQFLNSCWHEDQMTIMQRLLLQVDGSDYYQHWNQLLERLIAYEKEERASPQKLLAWLEEMQAKDIEELDHLKVRQANDEDAASILTLHMSKGLEFSVVFALGLANRTSQKEGLISVQNGRETSLKVCFSSDVEYQSYYEEIDAEKIRQLYVAMTRAKSRLYIPIVAMIEEKEPKEVAKGTAAPMELFLATLCETSTCSMTYEEKYKKIVNLTAENVKAKLDQLASDAWITYENVQTGVPFCFHLEDKAVLSLIRPTVPLLLFDEMGIHSYSSLINEMRKSVLEAIDIPVEKSIEFELEFKPTIYNLPKGAETGNVLHQLLRSWPQNASQARQSPQEICKQIKSTLQTTHLAGWEEVIGELLFNIFHTPIHSESDAFRLCDLDFQEIYREIEFVFSWQGDFIEEMSLSAGFITGIIDFIFAYKGKYYFIDWKSNWLGNTALDYSDAHMKQAMEFHNYYLQASIYATALQKYIQLVDTRPFEECFGGCFYLFLRGMNPNQKNSLGTHFFKPRLLMLPLLNEKVS